MQEKRTEPFLTPLTGNLNEAPAFQTATRLPDGFVVVTGGDGAGSTEAYNPATGKWRLDGSLTYQSPEMWLRFYQTVKSW
jgi:hypothetical protein